MNKPALSIQIKRAYVEASPADGTRVLVDRLWPRGLRKEVAALSCWLKDIAPSPELRAWFGHDPQRFDEFALKYRAELARNSDAVARLRALAEQGAVTLVYGARDERCNHAVVLADFLQSRGAGASAKPLD